MLEHGISQSRLAADLGLSQGAVSNWLRGAVPRRAVVQRLAERFGRDPEWLTGADEITEVRDPPISPVQKRAAADGATLAAVRKFTKDLRRDSGKRIVEFRKKSGLSVRAFAARCACDPTYIWRLEKGKVIPSQTVVNNVAAAFGLNRSELMYGVTPAPQRQTAKGYSMDQIRDLSPDLDDGALVRECAALTSDLSDLALAELCLQGLSTGITSFQVIRIPKAICTLLVDRLLK